jgi:hypothetical protein
MWSCYGVMSNNPGAVATFRVQFIWMFIFFLFTIFISIEKKIIIKTIYWASLSTSVIGLYMIQRPVFGSLTFLNWIPFEDIQIYNGLIRTSLPNIAFMSFLFPSLLFIKTPTIIKDKIFHFITLSLSFLFILLAGRRAIQFVVALSLIIFFIRNFRKIDMRVIIISLALVFISYYIITKDFFFFIDFEIYYDMYIKKLIVNISEEKRYIQIIELLKSFTQNPFIGVGFGKGIPTNIANAEKPWKYEVTYVLYLYQTGILGISLFLGLFISLFNKLKKLDLESKALAMGLIGYLMASFTNAYLISGFDYQFPVIICLLYISGATYYRGQKSFKYEKE